MPTQIKKEIICPKCGKNNISVLKIGVDSAENPVIKDKILDETIFDWVCKECDYKARISYPLLYIDREKNYSIALTPAPGKSDTISPTNVIIGMKKRRVKGLAELKEKIIIFDQNLNDIAIEIAKITLFDEIKEKQKIKKMKIYYNKIDENKNIEFAVFFTGAKKAEYHKLEYKEYEDALKLLENKEFSDVEKFARVGQTLALELAGKMKNI